jgi:hypothetical protein
MRNGVATWLMQRGDQLLTSARDGQHAEIQTFTVEIAFALRDSGSAKMLRSAYNWKVPRP